MADDSKLIIENAKWFTKQIENLSPADQNTILITKDFAEFEKILTNNGLLNSLGLWQGRADLGTARSLGAEISTTSAKPSTSKEPSSTLPGLGAIGASAGLLLAREESYNDTKKRAKEYADNAVRIWNDQEKKYKKNPPKNPDLNRARTAREAFERAEKDYHDMLTMDLSKTKKWLTENPGDIPLAQAIDRREVERKNLTYEEFNAVRDRYTSRSTRDAESLVLAGREIEIESSRSTANAEIHDRFVLNSPKLAREWAQKYNDTELYAAIERKRLRDEAAAIQNQSRLSKALRRNPTRNIPQPLKPAQPAPPNTTAWTPIPANTSPGTLPPNTLKNQGAPNTLKSAQPPTTQPPQGIRKKLNYYSPGQIKSRAIANAQNRAINSKIGQGFQKTRLGRLGSKLNSVSKRLKRFLNPLDYLLNLLKKSFIGSVASAISGVVSTALSAIAGGIVGIGGTVVMLTSLILAKILTGIGIAVSTVSLPIVVILAIIIFLVITIFSIFFAPSGDDTFIPEEAIVESPYAGISYFKVGPREVLNGENITYQIGVIHNSREAKCKLEDITFVDSIPPRSVLVESPELTTGNYRVDPDPETTVKWKLTENLTSGSGFAPMSFTFKITIDPEDDVTITNRIYIEGCAAEISTPDDSGDLFEGANSPPTTNDCGNSNYATIMGTIRRRFGVSAANYGDPLCNFSLDTLKAVLDRFESDPEKVDFFMKIAQCESVSSGPNGYGSSNNTWGHFQMDSHYSGSPPQIDPFKPWKEENNTKGDVPWQRQAQNAVSYNNVQAGHGNNFETWQTAYCFCYYPKYRNNRKLCGDIEEARKIQTPAECNNSCIPRIVNN